MKTAKTRYELARKTVMNCEIEMNQLDSEIIYFINAFKNNEISFEQKDAAIKICMKKQSILVKREKKAIESMKFWEQVYKFAA